MDATDRGNLPLSGITVVAMEQAIAAPLATRHLADWGARVIKIERPDTGDFCRGYDTAVSGMSSHFVWTNRSKQSVVVDLKDEGGRQALEALLASADVYVQNLAPGAARRLNLDGRSISEKFPSLIACDVSGYGESGPYSSKKAYDLLVQCETGFVSINGSQDGMAKCGVAIADIATGMYILNGVLMGLYRRAETGVGMLFSVSLFDALSEWMSYPALYTNGTGSQPRRAGLHHATIAPYGPFVVGDGGQIFIAVQNEREWKTFCAKILKDETLSNHALFKNNSERLSNRAILNEKIESSLSLMSSSEALNLLEAAGIATARINSVNEFLNHPQVTTRQRLTSVDTPCGPVKTLLPAISIKGCKPVMGPIPRLGEHNQSVADEYKIRL
jgi:itaconate CoA-transferase